jgi:acyl-CoA reductase-like NAD-dependent aldehyde dehydrogenase
VTAVTSVDARTGEVLTTVAQESTGEETAAACARAAAAFPGLEAMGRYGRAGLLRAMAGALEAARPEIVRVADRESALGEQRLQGELTRTCFQLRFFAEVLHEGSYVEATMTTPARRRPRWAPPRSAVSYARSRGRTPRPPSSPRNSATKTPAPPAAWTARWSPAINPERPEPSAGAGAFGTS